MEELDEAMEELDEAMEEVDASLEEVEISLEEVPMAVREAFDEAFSEIEEVEWELERGMYEAEFKIDGREYGIYFNNDGVLIAREKEIEVEDLPDVIKELLEAEYQEFEIDEVEIVESEDGDSYEIELESENSWVELRLNADGSVISRYEKMTDNK